MSTEKDDKNFLSRWSERKTAVREAELDGADEQVAALHPDMVEGQVDVVPEHELAEEDIPTEEDVEKLDLNSDFSVFMKAAVPQHIRRLALNKLWRLDPAYGVIDGMLEYGEDYSKMHKAGTVIQTAYQVGKGYFRDEEEVEAPEGVDVEDAVVSSADDPADAESPPEEAGDENKPDENPEQIAAEEGAETDDADVGDGDEELG